MICQFESTCIRPNPCEVRSHEDGFCIFLTFYIQHESKPTCEDAVVAGWVSVSERKGECATCEKKKTEKVWEQRGIGIF